MDRHNKLYNINTPIGHEELKQDTWKSTITTYRNIPFVVHNLPDGQTLTEEFPSAEHFKKIAREKKKKDVGKTELEILKEQVKRFRLI